MTGPETPQKKNRGRIYYRDPDPLPWWLSAAVMVTLWLLVAL
jgi:hypothetical protein